LSSTLTASATRNSPNGFGNDSRSTPPGVADRGFAYRASARSAGCRWEGLAAVAGERAVAAARDLPVGLPEVSCVFWCDVPVRVENANANELTVLVDRLRRDRRRDPYAGRDAYSRAVREVADRCERLIDAGEAAVAVPVLRKAVDRMTSALMYMDSSSGVLGNDLATLMEVYARACRAAPPRPAGLAAWLVKVVCDGPGWPEVVLREWAPALGVKGLAEVTRLVDERATAADPGERHRQWAVRYLREQLAEVSGDVDRHVRVLAEHLVSADQYGRIVRVLARAKRPAEAIDWARRGLAEYESGYQAAELRDLLMYPLE